MTTELANPNFYVTGGAVQATNGYYIRRPADSQLLSACQTGRFAYLLAARQVGKSSLKVATARRLMLGGVRTAQIDLSEGHSQKDADSWYLRYLSEVSDKLVLTTEVETWWSRVVQEPRATTYAERIVLFFRDVVLAQVSAPIVVFIDEIDSTIGLPFTDDFFIALRLMSENRPNDLAFHRLTFVVIGMATPHDLIDDPAYTPFAVGERITLTDFTPQEIEPLGEGLGMSNVAAASVLRHVYRWTSGHPYLTQRICKLIAQEMVRGHSAEFVNRVVTERLIDEGAYSDRNLQFVQGQLLLDEQLVQRYADIWRGQSVADNPQSALLTRLKLSGLVINRKGSLAVRNRIYEAVFDDMWLADLLPASSPPHQSSPPPAVPSTRRWPSWGWTPVAFLALVTLLLGAAWRTQRNIEAQNATLQAEVDSLQAQVARQAAATLQSTDSATSMQTTPAATALPPTQAATVLSTEVSESLVSATLQEETVERIGSGQVQALAYHPDGKIVAVATAYGVHIYDAETFALLQQFNTDSYYLSIAFSPDGRQLAAGNIHQTVDLWDALDDANFRTLYKAGAHVTALAYALNDASTLYVGTGRSLVALATDGSAEPLAFADADAWVVDLAIAPDTGWVAALSWQQQVKIYDRDRQLIQTLTDMGDVEAVAFSADNTTLAVGARSGTIYIWDWDAVAERWILAESLAEAHAYQLTDLAFSADNRWLASTARDGVIKMWNATDGSLVNDTLTPNNGRWGSALAFSPTSKQLVTAQSAGEIQWWQVDGWQWLANSGESLGQGRGIAVQPDWVAVALRERAVDIRSRATGKQIALLTRHYSELWDVAVSADGSLLASADDNGLVNVWRTGGDWPYQGTLPHTDAVLSLAFSPSGSQLATVTEAGAITLWDATTRDVLYLLDKAHDGPIHEVAFLPDGSGFVTAGDDRIIRFWRTADGVPLRDDFVVPAAAESDLSLRGVLALAISPDGEWLAASARHRDDSSADRWQIHMWRVADGALVRSIPVNDWTVLDLAFSPDSRLLASSSNSWWKLKLWRVADGGLLDEKHGSNWNIYATAFASDALLFTASDDGTLRTWRVVQP